MNRDLAPQSLCRRCHFVDDRQQRIGWTSSYQCRLAHGQTRFDEQIERVVVYGERSDFRAVIPGQVFPIPTRSILWSNEVSLIANEIALDSFHSRSRNPCREIVDSFEVVAVIKTSRDR